MCSMLTLNWVLCGNMASRSPAFGTVCNLLLRDFKLSVESEGHITTVSEARGYYKCKRLILKSVNYSAMKFYMGVKKSLRSPF